jgi:hypothetical protein
LDALAGKFRRAEHGHVEHRDVTGTNDALTFERPWLANVTQEPQLDTRR